MDEDARANTVAVARETIERRAQDVGGAPEDGNDAPLGGSNNVEDNVLVPDDCSRMVIARYDIEETSSSDASCLGERLSLVEGMDSLQRRRDGATVGPAGGGGYSSLPEDTYSMLMISSPGSRAALFSVGVFAFQLGLSFLIISDFHDGREQGAQRFGPPPGVSPTVRISQFLAIIVALGTQDDTMVSITTVLTLWDLERWQEFMTQFPREEEREVEDSKASSRQVSNSSLFHCCRKYCSRYGFDRCYTHRRAHYMANLFRFVQGLLSLVISVIIIVQSSTVIDLFKDFAAMAFVSTLDDVAFAIANRGFFGPDILAKAEEVTRRRVPDVKTTALAARRIIVFCLFAAMCGCWGVVVFGQMSGNWVPNSVTVQFGDEENFSIQSRSGVYEKMKWTFYNGRSVYREVNPNGGDRGYLVYCQEERNWVFGVGYDDSLWSYDLKGVRALCSSAMKAFSPTTEVYDLTKVPTSGWSVSNGLAMVPLSHFVISNNDCSGECGFRIEGRQEKKTGSCDAASSSCLCNFDFYGPNCQFKSPCQALEIFDNGTGFDGYASSYSLQGPVKVYGQPVYVHNYNTTDDHDLILFAGRRWVMMKISQANLIPEMLHDVNKFLEVFHFGKNNSKVLKSIDYLSEPTTGGTPDDLRWYKRIDRDGSGDHAFLKELFDTTFVCLRHNSTYCIVDNDVFVGDGVCDGIPYNREECGWDGGDCAGFNELYPNCNVEFPDYIGDGDCDEDEGAYNTEACGYDGGDCSPPEFHSE